MKENKLFFVAGLLPHKGCHILIEAVNILKKRGIPCVLQIAGDGKEMKNLINLTAKFKLDKEITFLGIIQHEKIIKFYKECDIFVSASLKESFGVAVVEALASGKPVVVTKCGGPESFVNRETGVIVNKGDSFALAAGIEKVIRNYKMYNPGHLRNYVKEKFSNRSVTRKIIKIYHKVLNL